MAELVTPSPAKGRKRKPWAFVGLEEVGSDVSLRTTRQQWLQKHNMVHKTPTSSTHDGCKTLIGGCHSCTTFDKQYCSSFDADGRLRVEETGSCTELPKQSS